ncbi:hypothetical protein D3C86_1973520 [compost metagenome]
MHRITGIERQVQQGVFQLIAVDVNAPGLVRQLHIDLYGFSQRPLQYFAQAFVNLPQAIDRRRQRLPTGEGKQL